MVIYCNWYVRKRSIIKSRPRFYFVILARRRHSMRSTPNRTPINGNEYTHTSNGISCSSLFMCAGFSFLHGVCMEGSVCEIWLFRQNDETVNVVLIVSRIHKASLSEAYFRIKVASRMQISMFCNFLFHSSHRKLNSSILYRKMNHDSRNQWILINSRIHWRLLTWNSGENP